MNQLNYKTMIAPVISTVVLSYELLSGHHLDETFKNEILGTGANVFLGIASVWGIFKNHKKEVK
jgi:hypothetical protein